MMAMPMETMRRRMGRMGMAMIPRGYTAWRTAEQFLSGVGEGEVKGMRGEGG